MQNMHKSMYLHILHIYALPTLLMSRPGRDGTQTQRPTRISGWQYYGTATMRHNTQLVCQMMPG